MSQVGLLAAVQQGGPQSRRQVSGMGRDELEDRHISLLEENHLLKKHARALEEKMKKMATKLLRLAADEKREARKEGRPPSAVQVRELEGEVEELVAKIRTLEKTNSSLQSKIVVLKQQNESRSRRRTPYDHVQSRISSGRRTQTQRGSAQSSPSTPVRYGRSLLEEARRDNQQLEELVLKLKQEVSVLTAEAKRNQEQLRLQSAEHEQKKLSLQQELQTLSTTNQKRRIEEDVEVIKVQKEVREKSDRLLVLETQYSSLEKNLETMKANQIKLLKEIDIQNTRLKEEQTRTVELQSRLNSETVVQGRMAELEQRISSLQAENDILTKTNNRLIQSPFSEERGSDYREQVRVTRRRISEPEQERDPDMHQSVAVQQRQREEGKARQVEGGAGGSIQQLQQNKGTASVSSDKLLTTLRTSNEPDGAKSSSLHRELHELRLAQEAAAAELQKTRHLLDAQRSVNQEYQKEVLVLRSQISPGSHTQTLHPLGDSAQCTMSSNHNPQYSEPKRPPLLNEQRAVKRRRQREVLIPPKEERRMAEVEERGEKSSAIGQDEDDGSVKEAPEHEEEEENDVSVSSSTQSSPEAGTPSTSTPLRPPLAPPSPTSLPPPPPLPLFSSSISVIAEPTIHQIAATEEEDEEEVKRIGGGGGFVIDGGGGEREYDSVSVTVTELSDEEEEEEEEEDTMFEETLPYNTTESSVSGRTLMTPTTPTQPSVRLATTSEEEEEEEGYLSSSPPTSGLSPSVTNLQENQSSFASTTTTTPHQLGSTFTAHNTMEDVLVIMIERFTVEPASSLQSRRDILGFFVELQLLDYEDEELETSSVPVSSHHSKSVVFNFRKEFPVGPSQKALLTSALSSSSSSDDNPDKKIVFTVVSDPVEQEGDCGEVGTAEVDLTSIQKSGRDIVNKKLKVKSSPDGNKRELLGTLVVSVYAAHILTGI